MGLYDIMVAVLKEYKAMTASELGEYIRVNDLYKQKDGTPLKDSQVHARVHHRSDLFMKINGEIVLYDPNVVLPNKIKTALNGNHKVKTSKHKVETKFGAIKEFMNDNEDDWFSESNISRALVKYLSADDYHIIQDLSDNSSMKGIDIIVEKNQIRELIEVKGYPSIYYKQKSKKDMKKKTTPTLQCTHWFDGCLSATIKNYESKSDVLAMAFPACDRYEALMYARQAFFTDNNLDIKVYFVKEDGSVVIDNMNKNLVVSEDT